MREKEFLPLVSSVLGIESLNDMQQAMLAATPQLTRGIMLLAPTGSGKTLAFALPLLKTLNPPAGRVQAVIIAPGRELVLQIAGILRRLAPAYRLVTLYGGHSVKDEVNSLSVPCDIIVATPGRLLDHINRRNVEVITCRIVVLDEFDKSLSLGFEQEMKRIFSHLKNISRIILTSATEAPSLPEFITFDDIVRLDYLEEKEKLRERAPVHVAESDAPDKLETLLTLLERISNEGDIGRTAVFVNYRESAERVHAWLAKRGVPAVLYHGALDQAGREKALALFRAGSRPVMITTDLGARGLDVEGVDNVIHYHLPPTAEDWTHRNGRTARAGKTGDIYVIKSPKESLPEYMEPYDAYSLDGHKSKLTKRLDTLWIGAGKREKISRGDLLGWLVKECGVPGSEIGRLEVTDHFSLATMPVAWACKVLSRGKNQRIKGSNRRVSEA